MKANTMPDVTKTEQKTTSTGTTFQVNAELQKPIEILTTQFLDPATSFLLGKHKYQILIDNKTNATMTRIGTHNDS